MSFFAYLAVDGAGEDLQERLLSFLEDEGHKVVPRSLAVTRAYGDVKFAQGPLELEFLPDVDIEAALLGDAGSPQRLEHYRECARSLCVSGTPFLGDERVIEEYLRRPLQLPVVRLLKKLAASFSQRPIVLVLDPDWSAHIDGAEAFHDEEIEAGIWRVTALRDLEMPVRLVVTRGLNQAVSVS